MKIIHTKIFVNDQDKALKFYTETLGFIKKSDVTNEQYRWLTIVSPDDQDGTELILEKNDNPAAKTYQKAIFEQGIPATMFGVADIQVEYERLKAKSVRFTMEPTNIGSCYHCYLRRYLWQLDTNLTVQLRKMLDRLFKKPKCFFGEKVLKMYFYRKQEIVNKKR